jgi:preprotein translocase subunit SecA
MGALKIPEDQPIENKLISRAIEQAQTKVEGFHFDMRKNLVEFDDVANQQREIVYGLRRRVLESDDLQKEVLEKLRHQVDGILVESWFEDKVDTEKIVVGLLEIVPFDDKSRGEIKNKLSKIKDKDKARELLVGAIEAAYQSREKQVTSQVMREIEKFAYLGSIDHHWIDHIDQIDSLREGVRLRAYGQRDPVVEFKNEAFDLFEGLLDRIDAELARRIFRIGVARAQRPEVDLSTAQTNVDQTDFTGLTPEATSQEPGSANAVIAPKKPVTRKKIGRNDPCWCGSGKKFKHCHYPNYG